MRHRRQLRRGFAALAALAIAGLLIAGSPISALAAPLATSEGGLQGQWQLDGTTISGSDLSLVMKAGSPTATTNQGVEPCTIDNPENCPINRPQPAPTATPMPEMPPMDPQPNIPPMEVMCRSFDPVYQIYRDALFGPDIILLEWRFHVRWCFNNIRPDGEKFASYSVSQENPRPLSSDARVERYSFPPVVTSGERISSKAPPSFIVDFRRAAFDGAEFEVVSKDLDCGVADCGTSDASFFFTPLIVITVDTAGTAETRESVLQSSRR